MIVDLLYDRATLPVDLQDKNVSVVQHPTLTPLENEKAAFFDAIQGPIRSKPLDEIVKDGQKIALVLPDGTRPLPSKKTTSLVIRSFKT